MTQTPTNRPGACDSAATASQPAEIAASFDYRGLKCPLPVLKARRALSALSDGEAAEFLADDPASPLDMAHFCTTEGHALSQSLTDRGDFCYVIVKSGATR